MSYTWTDNTMKSGTPCDVDKVADNLMHLKYEHVPQLNTPNSINSGVVNASGDANILNYSGNVVSFDTTTPITITTADKKSSAFTSVSSVTIPATPVSSTFNLYMGHSVSTMTLSQKFAESVKSQVTASSIKGLYDFGSVKSGTTVPDLSGNGHNITLSQDASTLLADDGSGLDFSKGNGDYWVQTATIASGKLFVGLCKLQNGEYLATEQSTGYVYASSDKITWTQRALIEAGTNLRHITQLTNDTVVVVSMSGKIYKSTDNGVTWDAGLTVHSGAYEVFQLSNGDVLLGAGNRLYKSTDNAASFPTYATFSGVTNLTGISQTSNGDVLVCSYTHQKIYRSTDNATTWDAGTSFTTQSIYSPLNITLNQDGHIIISHAITSGGAIIYVSKSTDNGLTFQSYKITPVLGAAVSQFMVDNDYLYFVGANNYLYQSVATWTIADNDDMSFGNGATDSPFSLLWNGKLNNIASRELIAKWDETTGATKSEYSFELSSTSKLCLTIYDNSVSASKQRYKNTALTSIDIGVQKLLSTTYSGANIHIQQNATQVDDVGSSGSYTAMENLTANIGNYYKDSSGNKVAIGGQIVSNVAIIGAELSTLQITNIYNSRIDIEMYAAAYTVGKAFPAIPATNAVHFLTSVEPAKLYKYSGTNWAEYNKVLLGQAVTNASGVVTSVVQPKFNQNGYDLNSNTTVALGNLWISSDYNASSTAIANVPVGIDLSKCMVQVLLKCVVAQGGYAVGDIAPFNYSSGSDSNWNGACIDYANRTVSTMIGGTLFIPNKNSSGFFYGTPSNWCFVFQILY